jgi:hypothetical protein
LSIGGQELLPSRFRDREFEKLLLRRSRVQITLVEHLGRLRRTLAALFRLARSVAKRLRVRLDCTCT